MHVAPDSNRSLPEGEVDADFDAAFDANGNLLQLVRGQTLEWDVRNQLQQITSIIRATAGSDNERYIYDSQGQRCRKINSTQTSSRTLNNEVRYLPGLEIRTTANGEVLHVICAQAGRSSVRVLHWQTGLPSGVANDQIRYSLSDHLGSSTLELDQHGSLISQESYYPFGGTSWWAARSAVEAKYKTVRYSGKERDASGLYYYGFRYYAPWLQRWISPDPAGDVNGLNLFCFVGNTPVLTNDRDGRFYSGRYDVHELAILRDRRFIHYRGLGEFPAEKRQKVQDATIESHRAFQNALYMINEHLPESTETMQLFFGHSFTDVKDKIVESWEQTFMLAAHYRGELGKDKFVGVSMNASSVRAFVIPKDPHGRVMLNINEIDTPDLPTLLSHELTHLVDVSGSTIKGAGALDYYYLNAPVGQGMLSLADQRRANSGRISTGGMDIEYLPPAPAKRQRFIEKIKTFHPFPDSVQDIDSAIATFNSFPAVMSQIASENADTLALAAHQLHENFKRDILPNLRRQQARYSHA
jgi:insecticidal toxin complex protein TccC